MRNTKFAALIGVLLLANTSQAIVVERLLNRDFETGTGTTATNWTIPGSMNITRVNYTLGSNFFQPGTLPAASGPFGLQSVTNFGNFAAVDITQTVSIPAGTYNIVASGWGRVYDDSAGQSRTRVRLTYDATNLGFADLDNNDTDAWTPWTQLVSQTSSPVAVTGSATFLFRVVANGTSGWSQVVGDTFSLTTEANNSTITAPASAAFGRVMQNQTPTINFNLTKTGSDATTFTATGVTGIGVTASGTIASGSPQTEPVNVQLQNNASGSANTGVKSYSVTVDNTANTGVTGLGQGIADANDSVSVSATVVANRTISASAVNLGSVIKGALTAPASSSLTTTGDDNNFTRVTVNGTSATDGSATVAAGSTQLFNAAASTVNRSVSASFSTAGPKSGDVVLSTTGEGLAGEAINPVSVHYTATAFDPSTAAFLANGGNVLNLNLGTFQWGSGVQNFSQAIYNILQAAGYTAELDFDTISGSGTTSVLFTDLMNGEFTALAAGVPNAYQFNVKFDTNNTSGVYNASYQLYLSDANAYAGAGAAGSQLLTLNLTGTIVPEPAVTILLVLILGLPGVALCRRAIG